MSKLLYDPSATYLSSRERDYVTPYVFEEFPKWVDAPAGRFLVQTAEEEAMLFPDEVDESGDTSDERTALMEQARALGLNPHHRAGAEKLRQMILDHETV